MHKENTQPLVQKAEKTMLQKVLKHETFSFLLHSLSTYYGVFNLLFNVMLPHTWGYVQGVCRPSQVPRGPAHPHISSVSGLPLPPAAGRMHHALTGGGKIESGIPLSHGFIPPPLSIHSRCVTLKFIATSVLGHIRYPD